jgi:enoyl-CoA hydratase/carnithine racemase
MVRTWFALPQPLVIGIKGAALGGGLEFALSADLIAVAEDAVLGFPEVSLGIIPAAGGTQLLSFRNSQSVASRWILTGHRFSGREAYLEGVADFAWPADGFTAAYEDLLATLVGHAPLALRQAKKALRGGHRAALDRRFTFERSCYTPLIQTEDRTEALSAFLEKRPPVWKGR